MNHDEANDILNRFMGQRGSCLTDTRFGLDYFADTPEAREAVRLAKDEFRKEHSVRVISHGAGDFSVDILFDGEGWRWMVTNLIESHAIALALAAAIKENRK